MSFFSTTASLPDAVVQRLRDARRMLRMNRSELFVTMLTRYGDRVVRGAPKDRHHGQNKTSIGVGMDEDHARILIAQAERLRISKSYFVALLIEQFAEKAMEELTPNPVVTELPVSIGLTLPPRATKWLCETAIERGMEPSTLVDQLIRETQPGDHAWREKTRAQYVLRETRKLRELTFAGNWPSRSALVSAIIDQAMRSTQPTQPTQPAQPAQPRLPNLPVVKTSKNFSPAELVDTFVSEVYDPTWDEPNRTVLVRGEPARGLTGRSNHIVREEVENTWHVWLTQSGLPQTQLVHAMWQRAMKSHAYSHPTARSLV